MLVARLRDEESFKQSRRTPTKRTKVRQSPVPPAPVLSDAEIARREKAFDAAYKIFQSIRKNYSDSPTAEQARGEIMMMTGHWRTIRKWRRAARLTARYLKDNPTDTALPQLRLGIARDFLAWAAQPIDGKLSTQEMLVAVAGRYDKARKLLAEIAEQFPDEKAIVHQGQWQIANSFLTQGRVVARFSATLARGQYVRAARELQQVAVRYHDHPNIAAIPQMLWDIASELAGKGYYDEAIIV
ncbi:MAG: tetratricopeptide repeat protein, partial [Planctomycetes bacterium]|nr:tetratricopeptide repeat protein [Planctomycetota bacterium]